MALNLTSDQIAQLQSLGIAPPASSVTIIEPPVIVTEPVVTEPPTTVSEPVLNESNVIPNTSEEIKETQESSPTIGNLPPQTISSTQSDVLLNKPKSPIIPILSISGLTFISFGGLVLFNSKSSTVISTSTTPIDQSTLPQISPTQVPKSIQHYLLTSQQFFTQALEAQASCKGNPSGCPPVTELLNQSILTASEAIKEFPSDSRAYEQRGRIYLSLIDSDPKLLPTAIADLSLASKLNPNSAEITRTLATLFARQGDAKSTLAYLTQTISLEPTKAQNFYDLAKLQQQTGQLSEALVTYNRLATLISDPTQKVAIESEKSAIEKLLSQNPTKPNSVISPATAPTVVMPAADSPLLQADAGNDLIIAAPETAKDISVTNLSSSNSLSGTGTLPANTAQVTLSNTNLTATSQVYLTVTKGGKNLTLQVISKSADSFVVGLDSPTTEPIEFKWWIIN